MSKAVRGDRELAALIKAAPRLDARIITSALTTLEAWNPRETKQQALWDWTVSRLAVVRTDDRLMTTARTMLKSASLHGHKYAIDAVLAAVAVAESERGADVTVFTSDIDDLERLLAGRPVRVERV